MSTLTRFATNAARRTLGRAIREWPRWWKARAQRRHPANRDRAMLAFVVGTQRSGTTMLMEVLDRSFATAVYHEFDRAAMDSFRMRPTAVIDKLAGRSHAAVVVLKPLTESQAVDRLLHRFPDSRAVWVFRSYQDVANSALAMWPGRGLEFPEAVMDDDLAPLDWRGERVSARVLELVRGLAGEPLSEQDGAALFWYARNDLYFDLGLMGEPRMLLVQYESLVQDPTAGFTSVFSHLGIPFDPRYVSRVKSASLKRRPFGPIHPLVQHACDDMMVRLQDAASKQESVATRRKRSVLSSRGVSLERSNGP